MEDRPHVAECRGRIRAGQVRRHAELSNDLGEPDDVLRMDAERSGLGGDAGQFRGSDRDFGRHLSDRLGKIIERQSGASEVLSVDRLDDALEGVLKVNGSLRRSGEAGDDRTADDGPGPGEAGRQLARTFADPVRSLLELTDRAESAFSSGLELPVVQGQFRDDLRGIGERHQTAPRRRRSCSFSCAACRRMSVPIPSSARSWSRHLAMP